MEQFDNQFVKIRKGEIIPVITVDQIVLLTGRKYNQIAESCQKVLKSLGETSLNAIYPFPHDDTDPFSGPRFIVMDDKYENYIEKCLNNPIKKKK